MPFVTSGLANDIYPLKHTCVHQHIIHDHVMQESSYLDSLKKMQTVLVLLVAGSLTQL